jgi:inosine-uridine nucleoside N-ribohydrolase
MAIRLASPLAVVLLVVAACAPGATPAPSADATASDPGTTLTPSPSVAGAIRLVVDTDMAPDDVTAILSLVRDPRVELLAITVTGTGEAHCPGGMFVARSVLTMLDITSVPVACGRQSPFGDAEAFPAEWRAGADIANGLGLVSPAFAPDDRDAAEILIDLARAESDAGRTLTILTIGTLTNVAGAVALDPDFAKRVRVVSMLGAIGVPGNVQPADPAAGEPTAEWNAHADPTAVRLVLEAGIDLTLVPLDATNDVPLTHELYAQLESDHAAGPADIAYELFARNPYMLEGDFFLWDPLAAAVVRDPSLVRTRTATVRVVEGAGLDGGRLVEDPAGAPVTVAISADRAAFEAQLLASLRSGPARANSFVARSTIRIQADGDTCRPTLDPSPIPPGLLRLELDWAGRGPMSAFLFATAGVDWSDLEAFVANPDFENPPAVAEVTGVGLDTAGSGVGYGEVEQGPLGLACAFGSFEEPTFRLYGPFEVAG